MDELQARSDRISAMDQIDDLRRVRDLAVSAVEAKDAYDRLSAKANREIRIANIMAAAAARDAGLECRHPLDIIDEIDYMLDELTAKLGDEP